MPMATPASIASGGVELLKRTEVVVRVGTLVVSGVIRALPRLLLSSRGISRAAVPGVEPDTLALTGSRKSDEGQYDLLFWTAESTERTSRFRDGLAFAGLV